MTQRFIVPALFIALVMSPMTRAANSAPVDSSPAYPTVSLNSGSTAVFSAVVTGTPAPTYQWQKGGVNLTDTTGNQSADVISGSLGPQLVITNATTVSNGSYTCVATNSVGSVTTAASVLTVTAASSPGYVISLSARADVKTNDQILIGGFYIVGTTSRTVLIQAIGPALSTVGVSNVLPDPTLAIHHYDSQGNDHILYTNSGWSTGVPAIDNVLLNTAAAAYATPVLQVGSKDSELLLTLPPGGYTAEIYGTSGDTGVALCGIYELD